MSHSPPRLFAIIPAAGRSRRMGRPKLLLPFADTTVIGRLLETLAAANVEPFVLIRPGDDELQAEIARTSATTIQPPNAPPEMRFSVELLIEVVEQTHHPVDGDGWLLIPADHPLLQSGTLTRLMDIWRSDPASIVLPCHDGRRGHPTIFPWRIASAVAQLPGDVGVNQLLHDHPEDVVEVPVDDPTVTLDLDTPRDYEQALRLRR